MMMPSSLRVVVLITWQLLPVQRVKSDPFYLGGDVTAGPGFQRPDDFEGGAVEPLRWE